MLNRIIIHWTAGSYTNLELDHYHYVVDKDGIVHNGKLPPEANIPKNGEYLTDERYVKHCGGGNSNSIGISAAAMGAYNSANRRTPYPITETQGEALWALAAKLCKRYNIPPENVLTHAEFGKLHPDSSSAGKIDITYLPYNPTLVASRVGPYIRNKVRWYLDRLGEK